MKKDKSEIKIIKMINPNTRLIITENDKFDEIFINMWSNPLLINWLIDVYPDRADLREMVTNPIKSPKVERFLFAKVIEKRFYSVQLCKLPMFTDYILKYHHISDAKIYDLAYCFSDKAMKYLERVLEIHKAFDFENGWRDELRYDLHLMYSDSPAEPVKNVTRTVFWSKLCENEKAARIIKRMGVIDIYSIALSGSPEMLNMINHKDIENVKLFSERISQNKNAYQFLMFNPRYARLKFAFFNENVLIFDMVCDMFGEEALKYINMRQEYAKSIISKKITLLPAYFALNECDDAVLYCIKKLLSEKDVLRNLNANPVAAKYLAYNQELIIREYASPDLLNYIEVKKRTFCIK